MDWLSAASKDHGSKDKLYLIGTGTRGPWQTQPMEGPDVRTTMDKASQPPQKPKDRSADTFNRIREYTRGKGGAAPQQGMDPHAVGRGATRPVVLD